MARKAPARPSAPSIFSVSLTAAVNRQSAVGAAKHSLRSLRSRTGADSSRTHSAGVAKERPSLAAPACLKVVIPTSSPSPLNSPPPEEPGETAASVWTIGAARLPWSPRNCETMPRERDSVSPCGAPTA